METTVGQLLVNSVLPEDLRDQRRVLNKPALETLLKQIAARYPERYSELSKQLSDVGHEVAFANGGHSFGLSELQSTPGVQMLRLKMEQQLRQILADKSLDPQQRNDRIVVAAGKFQQEIADTAWTEARAKGNPLAMQIESGARGNKTNLNSLVGADGLYVDHRGEPIPIPVTRSYAQGLTPAQYFAGAFGARKGVMDLAMATQDAGFLAKQLVQATHRLLVTAHDGDESDDTRGLPVDLVDPDNEGALLARSLGGYQRNTILTPRVLADLRLQGHQQALVRSPLVGGPADGGVYGRDVGVREKGQIAPIGDFVGVTAAQALSEPITQATISSKHSGGVAGASAGAIGGFKAINQQIQVPKKFKGGAAHAQVDGRVSSVVAAPQGGHYVTIEGKRHYVGQGYDLHVKPGDSVEAGDVISDGIPSPAEIVKHKGIGEGRRYFVESFRRTLRDSNVYGHRRNIELLARGLINHVRLTDEVDNWVPDDVIPYTSLEHTYKPRPGAVTTTPPQAIGQYLEQPILHYTIGTKVQPSMLPQLQHFGVTAVQVHRQPPPFEPEMIRGMTNAAHDPDWMTKMLGSYQSKSLLESARRGGTSDAAGSSFVPALAEAKDFGLKGLTQGYEPATRRIDPHPWRTQK